MPSDDDTKHASPRWNRVTSDAVRSDDQVAETLPLPDAASPRARPSLGAFDARADRYVIGEELGRGGMGRVLAAVDSALDRPVAIKQALTDEPHHLLRFEREARITAKLGHPAIVPVHDVGRDRDGHPYYVMRQIAGKPLHELVRSATTTRARLALLPNALAAIDAAAFAHARRVIHRDIKPSNILVGDFGETLLIDWGLARELDTPEDDDPAASRALSHVDPVLTYAGAAFGTPGFMAPEQARGEPADARADVYALGATLFYLVAAEVPFGDLEATAWIAKACADTIVSLAPIPDDVPAELVAIIGKALAPKLADRYADAGALAADLKAFAAGQLVGAHRYTAWERVARFVRRHAIAVSAIALAIVAIGLVGAIAIANVVRERDRATVAQQLAETRADQLLVDRAAQEAEKDPTRAIAMLATLRPDSPVMADARDVAAIAAAHGIARGAVEHDRRIVAIAIAPDGTRLASASDDGEIKQRELAGTSRTIYRTHGRPYLAWLDANRLVVGSQGSLVIVEADGRATVLDAAREVDEMWLGEDRIYVHDRRSMQVLAYGVTPGAPEVVGQDIAWTAGAGDVALFASRTGAHVYAHGRLSPLRELAEGPITIAAGAERVAAVTATEILEWDLAGAVVARTPIVPGFQVSQLFYGRGGLHYVRSDRLLRALVFAKSNTVLSVGRWAAVDHTSSTRRDVFATTDGEVILAGPVTSPTLLAGTGVGSVFTSAQSADGSTIAIGTSQGQLLWWRAEEETIHQRPIDALANPFAFDGDRLYGMENTTLVELERAPGTKRLVAEDVMGCIPEIYAHRLLCQVGPGGVEEIDLPTGKRSPLPTAVYFVDATREALWWYRDGVFVERSRDGTPHVRARIADVTSASGNAGWLVALDAAHTIQRFHDGIALGSLASPAPVERFTVASDGVVWFVRGRELHRWEVGAAAATTIGAIPGTSEVVALRPILDGVVVSLADGSVWYGSRTAIANRIPPHNQFVSFSGRVVVAPQHGRLAIVYLTTGRTAHHDVQVAQAVAVSRDARTIAAGTLSKYLVEIEDPVPLAPSALLPWLHARTNARLLDGDVLVWR